MPLKWSTFFPYLQDGLREMWRQDGINLIGVRHEFGFCCCCHYLNYAEKSSVVMLRWGPYHVSEVFCGFFCIFCIPSLPSAFQPSQHVAPQPKEDTPMLFGARLMGLRMGSSDIPASAFSLRQVCEFRNWFFLSISALLLHPPPSPCVVGLGSIFFPFPNRADRQFLNLKRESSLLSPWSEGFASVFLQKINGFSSVRRARSFLPSHR